jgi:cytosine/adenosine deaminase-related metal-dependent hydrolase
MQNPDSLFQGMMGMHASFTLDDDTLLEASQIASGLSAGCHIHLAEDISDCDLSKQRYKKTPVHRLMDSNVLGNRSILAHGIHLEPEEMDILSDSKSIIVHNPQSNMNNAVGRTNIFELNRRNILLGLGTDGMSADIRPDIRTGNLIHKHDLKDNTVAWQEICQMVLTNNPAIYRRVSGQEAGQIKVGSPADMIIVDYFPPTPLTADNFWGHFLFGIADAEVDTTIINGKIVMEKKEITGIDEAKIAADSQQVAEKVWNRFAEG